MQQDSFDVLARSQAIDPKINALTGELPLAGMAHFDGVIQPAARLDAKIGEDWMTCIDIRNTKLLRPGAQPPAVDFIFIGGTPIVR